MIRNIMKFNQDPDSIESPGGFDAASRIQPVVLDMYDAEETFDETGKAVLVGVFAPKRFPGQFRTARARLKAARAVGVLNSSVSTIEDILSNKEVVRLTTVKDKETIADDIDYLKRIAPDEILEQVDIAELELTNVLIIVNT